MKKDFKGLLCIWTVVALLCGCFIPGAVLAEVAEISLYPKGVTESCEVPVDEISTVEVTVGSPLKEQESVKEKLTIALDMDLHGWNVWGVESGATGFVMIEDPVPKGADWVFSADDAINYPAYPATSDGYIITPITHAWDYALATTDFENDTIKATCQNAECEVSEKLTLRKPGMQMVGDGNAAEATLSAESFANLDALPEINYKGTGETTLEETTTAPTTVGTYRAFISVEDIVAYVDYTIAPKAYAVTFDSNGGSDVAEQNILEGEKVVKPENPTQRGYSFLGWYIENEEYDFDTPVTSAFTLEAKWRRNSTSSSRGNDARYYLVSFESNGGTEINTQNIKKNNKVEQPENPVKEGFVFEGWFSDKELTVQYDFEATVQNAFTLYAKWSEEVAEPEIPYEDVKPEDWFYEDVKFVLDEELIDGTSGKGFGPNEPITRADLVEALYRMEGKPEVEIKYTFIDVSDMADYRKAISWGQENGIIFGYSEKEFRPEESIIREQIAAIIHRYAAYKKYDLSDAEKANLLSYTDADEISDYAAPSVQYVMGTGIMQGQTDKTFCPKEDTTRAEISAIIRRFIKFNE